MRTRNHVVILLIVALVGSFAAIQAGQDNSATSQQTTQRAPSGTRFASCILRITVDPMIMPLDPPTVEALLHSSAVAGQAVREVLQRDSIETPWENLAEIQWLNQSSARLSPAAASPGQETAVYDREMIRELENIYGEEYMKQMGMSQGKQNPPAGGYGAQPRRTPPEPPSPPAPAVPSATVRLIVHLPENVPPAADEFLKAVIGNIENSLHRAYSACSSALQVELHGNEITLRGHRNAAVNTLQGGAGPGQPGNTPDVEALAAQRHSLESKLQELEFSLAGQDARRQAIAEQIAQMEHETQERLARDEVTRELTDLLKLSEVSLDDLRKQVDAGRASTADLARANENLTKARIELARRREELSAQAGGGQLTQLNGELSRMAIDRAEREAQRQILTGRLAQIQEQTARASTFDPDAARARMEREWLDVLSRRVAELHTRIVNLQPPAVTVIGAN